MNTTDNMGTGNTYPNITVPLVYYWNAKVECQKCNGKGYIHCPDCGEHIPCPICKKPHTHTANWPPMEVTYTTGTLSTDGTYHFQ